MQFDLLSKEVIGCAIEVHKYLGPGLLESAYEECLSYELNKIGMKVDRQKVIPINYKDLVIKCGYRLDLLVNNKLIVEVKSVENLNAVHIAQLLTYMRLSKTSIGLLINFNEVILKNGLKRLII
jgi:GxxExxY protein